eukprot:745550-Pyramimonas_sp.AAC.1
MPGLLCFGLRNALETTQNRIPPGAFFVGTNGTRTEQRDSQLEQRDSQLNNGTRNWRQRDLQLATTRPATGNNETRNGTRSWQQRDLQLATTGLASGT